MAVAAPTQLDRFRSAAGLEPQHKAIVDSRIFGCIKSISPVSATARIKRHGAPLAQRRISWLYRKYIICVMNSTSTIRRALF